MTHPIDTAYVDIVPVDKSLQKLQRDIDKAMKKIDKEAEKDLKKIDKNFNDTFANLNKYMDDMEKNAEKHFKELDDIVENSLGDVLVEFDDTFTVIDKHFQKLGDDSDRSFRRMRSRFFDPFREGVAAAGETLKDLGRAMGQLVSGIGGSISSNPFMALIVALIPAIIALSAALSQLIGLVALLPAGFGVLLSIVLPLVIAFQNFGDAVSAIADGDIDKINEALKKLSPSAASVAREVGAMLPMLRSFQRLIQEGFFAPLVGDFTNVMRALFPTLEKGFFTIAQQLGRMVSGFAELLSSANSIQVFRELFASTANIIVTLMGPFTRFVEMLLSTVHEALPAVERLAAAFGRALDTFSAFVNKSIETGDFDKFIEDAITTVKELIDLGKALGGVLKTLFAGTEESGHDFLKTLTDMANRLNEFLKSAEGQDAIKLLVFSVQLLGAALASTLEILVFFFNSSRSFLLFLEKLGRGFVDLVVTIGTWIGKVPGIVINFLSGIPALVGNIFETMIDNALRAIGIGVGLILFQIQVLPGLIIDFLSSLPRRIYETLVAIGPIVANIFQGAIDFARNLVVNGFNGVIDFIQSVPDRVRSLIPAFGKAGLNLIESFMNGFRSVGSFIGDIAGDIVSSVKGFLNKAIDKINSGIATIDNLLPGDLGRIPRLAEGALVRHRPGGILANVGEGNEDEVVAPLSKLEGMIKGGPSITFGAGAINVNFSGVVPTESEARQVGNAVGQGIIDMISRRNMRAQVRAV